MKRSDQWPERDYLLFGRDELQKIADLTIKDSANSSQDVDIQTGDFVVTIIVDLSPLHFRAVAQFVFADTGFLDQFIQFDTNGSVFFHFVYPYPSNVEKC